MLTEKKRDLEKEHPVSEKQPLDSWGFETGDEIYPGRHALSLLGGGRRYEAYLASDESLLSLVVLKILRPERTEDERSLAGLSGEWEILRALNHPVIVRGFDAVLEGDRPHITLEFLEGPRLSTLLRKHGALPLEQLIPLAVQLCAALHYMHGRGYVHLDVKPRNIIMGAPPRLIDLSVALPVKAAATLTTQVGTDAYMAPEQCDPTGAWQVGPAADIWGLGTILYESLTGRSPFPRPVDDGSYPQLEMDPLPLQADVPPAVIDVVEASLARDPNARPTPGQVADRLEPIVAALPRKPVLGRFRPRPR